MFLKQQKNELTFCGDHVFSVVVEQLQNVHEQQHAGSNKNPNEHRGVHYYIK